MVSRAWGPEREEGAALAPSAQRLWRGNCRQSAQPVSETAARSLGGVVLPLFETGPTTGAPTRSAIRGVRASARGVGSVPDE